MAVESLHVNTVYPHADSRYEWVEATVNFAVDPELLANERIVDLELAPRDEDGLVRFDADLKLLRPVEGGNGKLMFVVPNRGVPTLAPWLKNGFLLDRGYTIASCGWQWDVQRGSGIMGMTAPQADVAPGFMRLEWRSDSAGDVHPLSFTVPEIDSLPEGAEAMFTFTDYPTADIDDPEATLTVRTSPDAEPTTIPRENWRFTDETHLTLDGGFKAFHWYELVYRTTQAPVAGAGLLAIRDIVSHLRSDGIEHAFAYGVSQAGRLLRQFLTDGLNVDESGMTVFDGVFSEFASASTGEFNHRYAQPAIAQVTGFGNTAPFAASELLARQRELGCVPKTMFINSATEYWYSGGALLHVDPLTGRDLPEDPDVRTYLLASTDHFGSSKLKNASPDRESGAPPGCHTREPGTVRRARGVGVRGRRAPAEQGAADQRRHGGRPQGNPVDVQPHQRSGSLGASVRAADRPRTRRRSRHRHAGRSSRASPSSTWCRRSTRTATRWPASGCPRSPRRWPPTRAGTPAATSTNCPMCCTSGSAASWHSRRDGRRSPSATRPARTTSRQPVRPRNRLSPSGSCSQTRSIRS